MRNAWPDRTKNPLKRVVRWALIILTWIAIAALVGLCAYLAVQNPKVLLIPFGIFLLPALILFVDWIEDDETDDEKRAEIIEEIERTRAILDSATSSGTMVTWEDPVIDTVTELPDWVHDGDYDAGAIVAFVRTNIADMTPSQERVLRIMIKNLPKGNT